VTLVPGQNVNLPITVTNTGDGVSDPVTATLRLPPGVSVISPGTQALSTHALDAHPVGLFRQATQPASTTSVSCPPDSGGTATCSSPAGLRPGDSVVLTFRLSALSTAKDADITGTVVAGKAMPVDISVHVRVSQPPPPPVVDRLALTAHLDQWNSWWSWLWNGTPVLDITATNTGTSTKPVTVTVDRPATPWVAQPGVTCSGYRAYLTCTTKHPLAPKQSLHLLVRVYHLHAQHDTVTVTGTLGDATASSTVDFRPPPCKWLWCWPTPPGHHPPTSSSAPPPSATTTPPVDPTTTDPTSTDQPTTKPGEPTTKPSTPTYPSRPTRTTTQPPRTTTTTGQPPTETSTPPPTSTDDPPTSCSGTAGGPGKLRPGTICVPLLPTLLSLLPPL
jgi:hypothetical protein